MGLVVALALNTHFHQQKYNREERVDGPVKSPCLAINVSTALNNVQKPSSSALHLQQCIHMHVVIRGQEKRKGGTEREWERK